MIIAPTYEPARKHEVIFSLPRSLSAAADAIYKWPLYPSRDHVLARGEDGRGAEGRGGAYCPATQAARLIR